MSRSGRGEAALYWRNHVILKRTAGLTSAYLEYFPEAAALYAELQAVPTLKMLDRAKNPATIGAVVKAPDIDRLMTDAAQGCA